MCYIVNVASTAIFILNMLHSHFCFNNRLYQSMFYIWYWLERHFIHDHPSWCVKNGDLFPRLFSAPETKAEWWLLHQGNLVIYTYYLYISVHNHRWTIDILPDCRLIKRTVWNYTSKFLHMTAKLSCYYDLWIKMHKFDFWM